MASRVGDGRRVGGIVYVYSAAGKMPVVLKSVIDGRVPVTIVSRMDQWPAQTDYYCQTAGLNSASERAAAKVGALVIVLPEQSDYLAGKVWERVMAGIPTWIFMAGKSGDSAYIAFNNQTAQ